MKTVRFKADTHSSSVCIHLSGVSDRDLKPGDRVEVEYTDGCIVELVLSIPNVSRTCLGCVFHRNGCKATMDNSNRRPCIIAGNPANAVFAYKGDILEEL